METAPATAETPRRTKFQGRRSIVWSIAVGLAGFAIGQLLDRLLDDLRRYEWWIALALFCGVLIVLAWHGRDVLALRTLRLRSRKDEA